MTIYIINDSENPDLATVTEKELDIQDIKIKTSKIDLAADPLLQINQLADLDLSDGDIICFAGVVLRTLVWNFSQIANETKSNLMPGQIVDHRSYPVADGMFFSRKPQEENGYPGVPYVILIGDSQGAKESWQAITLLDEDQVWGFYKPETLTIYHWLSAAAALHTSWKTPDWFPIVDLSIRDLEIAPVMYATNHWSDWISFYPSAGNFKLENHAQLLPVWLDRSTKPLEYWYD